MADGRRRPGGKLIGLIGAGVGAAAEYREQRKDQKQQRLSRENSEQSGNAGVGSSSNSVPRPGRNHEDSQQAATRDIDADYYDAPPGYDDTPDNRGQHTLASGRPATDDKKDALTLYDDDSDYSLSTEEDEEDWDLDEVADRSQGKDVSLPPSYAQSDGDYQTTGELVQDVLLHSRAAAAAPGTRSRVRQPLPLPVILPQRRPGTKARGFVRAYAPVLDDSGIDQETFMSFLDNFDKSSKASPVFTVIQISAAIAGFAPSVIAMAVTTVVQIAARTGAEIQTRQRSNHYLDQMNEELFKPNGLYAFIMKYKPGTDNGESMLSRTGMQGQIVDFSANQIIAKYARTSSGDGSSQGISDRMKDLRVGSGTTHGSLCLPEAAPLIFPAIDNAIAQDGAEETFKTKAKDAHSFLVDYIDRRSQMKYAASDPNSRLVLPEEQRALKSKLADPNHPMFQGGLINMATGGALTKSQDRIQGRAGKRFDKDERRALKYEQRMGRGKELSRKKQSRYEHFLGESNRLGYDDSRFGGSGRRGGGGLLSGEGLLGRGGRSGGGGLIGGLVGAAINAASGNSSASASQQRRYEEDRECTRAPQQVGPAMYRHFSKERRGGAVGAVKRIMKEDVLYLMIVNMPSEGELARARLELARMKS
ncbi:hypothetical protein LTR62_006155 [Meristemomyces frigidus]|uniref:Uncharacterized protein n=1 Tax=Meristemomyces frigidus TaxID=1508187 RepID=A0AAN7YQ60_9PEZI|nr:hypothetical protein LTR62_006155 [Meristemomyces frigidus]